MYVVPTPTKTTLTHTHFDLVGVLAYPPSLTAAGPLWQFKHLIQ